MKICAKPLVIGMLDKKRPTFVKLKTTINVAAASFKSNSHYVRTGVKVNVPIYNLANTEDAIPGCVQTQYVSM